MENKTELPLKKEKKRKERVTKIHSF
jgi:hypothetical protein